MIEYGKIDLSHVTSAHLHDLDFQEYFQCYQQTPAIEQYYTKHNSSVWQMFDESPDWVHNLATLLPQDFVNYVVSVIKVDPGQTVPYHVDKHFKVQEKYGKGETYRYLVFLDDWKRGHYYEIQDQPFTKWRKGEWIKFGPNDWHLAGAMGEEPFLSAQVTVKAK